MMKSENTTIWLRKSTRERLKEMGKKGQSYDEIIMELLIEKETRRIIIEAGEAGTP